MDALLQILYGQQLLSQEYDLLLLLQVDELEDWLARRT